MIFANPRATIKSRKPGLQRMVGEALQYALSRWMVDTNYRRHLVRMAYDAQFAYCVSVVRQEAAPGYDTRHSSSPQWPKACRISPRRFVMDPLALHWTEGRYSGHLSVWDKDALIELADDKESGWNKKLLQDLAVEVGKEKYGRDAFATQNAPQRDELAIWEVWVPEMDLDDSPGADDGYHGTIYTIAEGQANYGSGKDEWVREPRPYYGPRWGPYCFAGIYTVPDSPWPLAPLQAVDRQAKDVNDQARAMSKASREYKRLVLVNSGANKLIQDLKSKPDMFVVPVAGLNANEVISLEIGGVTSQQIEQYNINRDRLDRQLSMADAQRGTANGRGTATENQIADDATSTRMAFVKEEFAECPRCELRTVAWYMYHDDRVIIPLGEDAAAELGMTNPTFQGGSDNPDDPRGQASFDDLELDIDITSMERPTDAAMQRRAAETTSVVTQLAPLVPQMPWVRWRSVLQRIGDSIRDPDFADLVDERVAAEMAGQQVAFEREPRAEIQSEAGPRARLTPARVDARGGRGKPGVSGGGATKAATAKPAMKASGSRSASKNGGGNA